MADERHGNAAAAAQAPEGQGGGHSHAVPAKKYFTVGLILAVVTALEVSVFYVEALRPLLVPLLLVLSFIKFVLVVMYFMHLRYDKVIFAVMLGAGLVMAVATFIAIAAIIP